jgi:hypothetical protein
VTGGFDADLIGLLTGACGAGVVFTGVVTGGFDADLIGLLTGDWGAGVVFTGVWTGDRDADLMGFATGDCDGEGVFIRVWNGGFDADLIGIATGGDVGVNTGVGTGAGGVDTGTEMGVGGGHTGCVGLAKATVIEPRTTSGAKIFILSLKGLWTKNRLERSLRFRTPHASIPNACAMHSFTWATLTCC